MSWTIKWDGKEFSSDDMNMEELEAYEQISGEPWSIANPARKVSSAKAFLTISMMRDGVPDKEIAERMKKITVKDLKDAFTHVAEESSGPLEEEVKKVTSKGSRSGARKSSTGPRKKRGVSASET